MTDNFDKKLEDKRSKDAFHTADSLNTRTIQHQKHTILQTEIKEWVAITKNVALSVPAVFLVYKGVFSRDSFVEKIVNLLIVSNNWVTQGILAALILGIFYFKKR